MPSAVPIDPFKMVVEWLSHAEADVRDAMVDAIAKHGMPTTDPVRGTTTLIEEVGEAAAEALDATRSHVLPVNRRHHLVRLVKELDQVAGYAILLRCSIEGVIRRESKGGVE